MTEHDGPRWWWSRERKYQYWGERGRRTQARLWELSEHGRYPIHLATFVNDRVEARES